jgi:GNAT superfamily N-acetyltransferase
MSMAIQSYRPELRDALFAFHARVFPQRDISIYERTWHWQYFQNPLEPNGSDRIWVVTRDGEVIAHLGTMAAGVRLNGEAVLGRWSSDLIVDPRYRNGGLGVLLIREWLQACDLALAKGLSREAIRIYERLGWEPVPLRPVAFLPLTARAFTGRLTRRAGVNALAGRATRWIGRAWTAARTPRCHDLRFRRLTDFPDVVDDLTSVGGPTVLGSSSATESEAGMTLIRNRRFLRWRYRDCPVGRYVIETAWRDDRLRGYAVFSVRAERGLRRGMIQDLQLTGGRRLEWLAFVSHCVRGMHAAGADEVALLPRTDGEERAAAALGFVSRGRPEMMITDTRDPGHDLRPATVDVNVQLGDGDTW